MPTVALGPELWLVFYDQQTNAYVSKCMGTVIRTQGDRAFAGGRWHEIGGYPGGFGSEEEADQHIAAHPFSVPTIK